MTEMTVFEVAELCEKLPVAVVIEDGRITDIVVEEGR